MIVDSEDVVNFNVLHLTAIACLTEDGLEKLGSRDGANSSLSDDNVSE